jgi:hypothetical protein
VQWLLREREAEKLGCACGTTRPRRADREEIYACAAFRDGVRVRVERRAEGWDGAAEEARTDARRRRRSATAGRSLSCRRFDASAEERVFCVRRAPRVERRARKGEAARRGSCGAEDGERLHGAARSREGAPLAHACRLVR